MIDHLVYVTHDLETARRRIEASLSVRFTPGGRHLDRGTCNVLLRLGSSTYLELLAIDPKNADVSAPRWMGIDALPASGSGRLSRWAWAVSNERIPVGDDGQPLPVRDFTAGSRALADGSVLRWKLTEPGASPLIAEVPFLIDWLGQRTPAERLPDQGLHLESLSVAGPVAKRLAPLRNGERSISLRQSAIPQLTAVIHNSSGARVILS